MSQKSLRPSSLLWLTPVCVPAILQGETERFRFDSSYQTYDEAAGRMFVESWYLRTEMKLNADTTFRYQVLRDVISGSSPLGSNPGSRQPFLVDITDVRNGVLAALNQRIGDHSVELELSQSRESDYLSRGLALSGRSLFNQENTTLSYGLNFLHDDVLLRTVGYQRKQTLDLFAGLSQLLDRDTILSLNLTLGAARGFLSEQYKLIELRRLMSIPDGNGGAFTFPVDLLYRENRPRDKTRAVIQAQLTRFVASLNGAADLSLRLGGDSNGVYSQTTQLEWRQGLGQHFDLTPYARFYTQTAADFYYRSLNEAGIENPRISPDGSGDVYSADYRLSSMATLSLGLKARAYLGKRAVLSLAFEQYDMNGIGSHPAPAAAYATATMWTLGLNLIF